VNERRPSIRAVNTPHAAAGADTGDVPTALDPRYKITGKRVGLDVLILSQSQDRSNLLAFSLATSLVLQSGSRDLFTYTCFPAVFLPRLRPYRSSSSLLFTRHHYHHPDVDLWWYRTVPLSSSPYYLSVARHNTVWTVLKRTCFVAVIDSVFCAGLACNIYRAYRCETRFCRHA